MITCIAIDDDPLFLKSLKTMIREFQDIDLKGSFTNPVEGIMEVVKQKPDVVLLDIEMPYLDGMEAMSTLDKLPKIIVISGHQRPAADSHIPIDQFIAKTDLMNHPQLLREALFHVFKIA